MSTTFATQAPSAEDPARARSPWSVWLALFAVAFALRALAAWQYAGAHPNAESLGIDEAAYDAWARRIAGGDVRGDGVFFQEPLYSYVLGAVYALFGPEKQLVRLAQALLGAALCVIAGKTTERVFGRASGLVAGALLAVHGPLILFPCFLLKEALLLPLLALLTWQLVASRARPQALRPWFAIGLLAGLGALLRGNVLVLAPCFIFWPLVRGHVARRSAEPVPFARAAGQAACVLGGLALVLAPVLARNHAVGGVWVLTTSQAGTNLYAGNNAENVYGRPIELGFVRGIPEHEADDWRREAERRTGRALDASAVSAFWQGETWRSVRADPALHLRILWNKLRLTLGAYEAPDNHFYPWDVQYVPWLAAPWPGFGLLAALGIGGLLFIGVRRARVSSTGAIDLAVLFALYLATIVLTVSSDRARLPLVLWLAPFAGAFVVSAARAAREGAWRSLGGHAGCAVLLGFVFTTPVLPASERDEDFDEREFNLAATLAADPAQLARARELVAGLVQRHPRSARTQMLANELALRGIRARLAEPVASARAAARADLDELATRAAELEMLPGLPPRELFRARVGRGHIELARGDDAAAERAFRGALAFDEESAEARTGLVRALVARTERGAGEDALASARSAESEIARLRTRTDGAERAETELLASRVLLARGRVLLATGRRAEGEPAIAAALKTLQPFASDETLPRGLRAAVRRQAGRIQLAIGTDAALASAERHFRAALALENELDAVLGLAQTLVTRAERASTGGSLAPETRAELRTLLDRLAAADADHPALHELAARAAALR